MMLTLKPNKGVHVKPRIREDIPKQDDMHTRAVKAPRLPLFYSVLDNDMHTDTFKQKCTDICSVL